MDVSDKRLLFRIIIDCLLLLAVGIPLTFIHKYLPHSKRGFFCNDQSIQYPKRPSTVSHRLHVLLPSILINFVVILFCEFIHHRRSAPIPEKFKGKQIPSGVWSCYCLLGTFLFGLAANQYLTILAKFTVGWLRPYFIAECQPNVNCTLPENLNKFITDFECENKSIGFVRTSFPSGHTSVATFAAVHLIIYLQARFPWGRLFRSTLQFFLAGSAMFVGLSRIADYKHHPMDVVVGAIIGAAVALFVTRFLVNYFDLRTTLRSTEDPPKITVEEL